MTTLLPLALTVLVAFSAAALVRARWHSRMLAVSTFFLVLAAASFLPGTVNTTVILFMGLPFLLLSAAAFRAFWIGKGRRSLDTAPAASSPARGRQRTLLVVVPIVVLAAAALWAYGSLSDPPPESRVVEYLHATARGDEAGALGIWQTCCQAPPALEARRVALTHELTAAGVGQQFRIDFVEWWRTCCEPGIINDPRSAGRARIFVSADDRSGAKHQLVFEVMTKDGAYWGDAAGNPRRDWTLREVYPRGEQSLRRPAIVPLTRDDAIRSSRSLAPVPDNAAIEAKRMSLADLRGVLSGQDFLPPADPSRSVWIVTATGEIGGGPPKASWSVVVLDADEHIVLGTRFGDSDSRPTYFDRLRSG